MEMKEKKRNSAEIIQQIAKKVVYAAVGKSLPAGVYEEEIPVEVQKWVREQRKSK